MADEPEGAAGPGRDPADKDVTQTGGGDTNAAQGHGGPERYPAVDQTDGVERTDRIAQIRSERRSFDPAADAPTSRDDADVWPTAVNEGRLGPQGDPAEGKR